MSRTKLILTLNTLSKFEMKLYRKLIKKLLLNRKSIIHNIKK